MGREWEGTAQPGGRAAIQGPAAAVDAPGKRTLTESLGDVSQIRRKAAEPPNQPGASAGPAAEPAEATGGSVWQPGDEPTWEDIEQAEAELIGDVGTDEVVAEGQGADVPGEGGAEPESNALDTARSGGGKQLPDALRTSLEATAGRDLSSTSSASGSRSSRPSRSRSLSRSWHLRSRPRSSRAWRRRSTHLMR